MAVSNIDGHDAHGHKSDAPTRISSAQGRTEVNVAAIVAKLALGARPVDYQACLTERTHLRKPSPLKALVPLMSIPDVVFMAHGLPPASVFPYQSMTIQLSCGSELRIDGELMATAQEYMGAGGYLPLKEWCRQHVAATHRPPLGDWSVALGAGITDMFDKLGAMLLRAGDAVVVERFSYPQALAALKPMGVALLPADTDEQGLIPSSFEEVCHRARAETGAPPRALYIVPKGQNPTGTCLAPDRYAAIYECARAHGMFIFEDDPYYFLQFPADVPRDTAKGKGGNRGTTRGAARGGEHPVDEEEGGSQEGVPQERNTGAGEGADAGEGAVPARQATGEAPACVVAGTSAAREPRGASTDGTGEGLVVPNGSFVGGKPTAVLANGTAGDIEMAPQQHDGPEEPLLGVAGLGPSFLSIDVDGRVLRLDSFSKILSPGLRVGWLSGPKALIDKYELHAQISSQNGATLSMVMVHSTLEKWGRAGFEQHLVRLQKVGRGQVCGCVTRAYWRV
eukprot:jgi/Mesvir1/25392/Mv01431-RA.1